MTLHYPSRRGRVNCLQPAGRARQVAAAASTALEATPELLAAAGSEADEQEHKDQKRNGAAHCRPPVRHCSKACRHPESDLQGLSLEGRCRTIQLAGHARAGRMRSKGKPSAPRVRPHRSLWSLLQKGRNVPACTKG